MANGKPILNWTSIVGGLVAVVLTSVAGYLVTQHDDLESELEDHEDLPAHTEQLLRNEQYEEDMSEIKSDIKLIKVEVNDVGDKVERLDILIRSKE